MAVVYNNDVKDDRLEVVLDAIDAGSGDSTLEIGTTSFASTLVAIPLASPSGAVSSQVLTFDTSPALSATAGATGTAAVARIKDGDGNVVVSGLTVGLSASDVILDSLSITTGQTVQINSATITHG